MRRKREPKCLPGAFLEGVPGRSRVEGIVKAAIRLSQPLGTRVVAKGVERKEQLQFLWNLRCDAVQQSLVGVANHAGRFGQDRLARWGRGRGSAFRT